MRTRPSFREEVQLRSAGYDLRKRELTPAESIAADWREQEQRRQAEQAQREAEQLFASQRRDERSINTTSSTQQRRRGWLARAVDRLAAAFGFERRVVRR